MIIDVAGIGVELFPQHEPLKTYCRLHEIDDDPVCSIPSNELAAATQAQAKDNSLYGIGTNEVFAALELVHMAILEHSCFFFHAALVEHDGRMYALSGPSGTGKSTLARLWRDVLSACIVNDDKPFLRLVDGVWYAGGSLWSGKERWNEAHRLGPLQGICFVEQAQENSIKRLDSFNAAERIIHQTQIPREIQKLDLLFKLVNTLVEDIPCFVLECSRTNEAAHLAYNTMQHGVHA